MVHKQLGTSCSPGLVLISGNCVDPATYCPKGKTLNSDSLICEDKKSYIIYIALAIAALFLLKGD